MKNEDKATTVKDWVLLLGVESSISAEILKEFHDTFLDCLDAYRRIRLYSKPERVDGIIYAIIGRLRDIQTPAGERQVFLDVMVTPHQAGERPIWDVTPIDPHPYMPTTWPDISAFYYTKPREETAPDTPA